VLTRALLARAPRVDASLGPLADSQISRRQLLAGGGMLALALAGCGASKSSGGAAVANSGHVAAGGGKEVGLVNWGLSSDIVALDPTKAWDYSTSPVMLQTADTLVSLASNAQDIEPNIATSWSEVSPTRYTYTIREGVRFHDGTLLTPEDVAYSLNRNLEPKVGSILSQFFANVASIKAEGNTVIVELARPDALWKYVPTFTPGLVISKANVEATLAAGKTPGTATTPTIGSGPFVFDSWQTGQSISFTRFDDYWNKAKPLKIKQLVFRVVSDTNTLAAAMLSGDIQGTFQLEGRAIKALAGASNVQVVRGPSENFRYLGFNVLKPPFDDQRVRQAISYALDKPGILENAYGGEGLVWNSPILKQNWNFDASTFAAAYAALPTFDQNLAKARRLIKEAGASGKGGTLLVSGTEENEIGLAVQQAAKEIGINFSIDQVPGATQDNLLNTTGARTYSAFVYNWGYDISDPAEALDLSFLSTSTVGNYSQYRSKQMDALLNKQVSLPNGSERAQLLVEIQRILTEQQVWIPLYQINTLLALSSDLGGYQINALWYWDNWAADLTGT
jgi:peptide/nickel transport system substrate-binding protein